MSRERAEEVALRLLGAMADNPEDLGAFLSLAGIGPAELRERAGDATFLAGLLDHVLSDEALLIRLCTAIQISFDLPGQARAVMPGHDWDRGSA
ncbi:DUF3572 domain-containing protein [Zavarzinia sp. CC-PAN008]|uniref:DUF3572 domain-containing protein n=1 Tax=Zavarzinia sp. CC-PAN008 TaxID=3243332 RepID=UPI003F7481D3